MIRKVIILPLLAATLVVLLTTNQAVLKGETTYFNNSHQQYYIDRSNLPFRPLPGLQTKRYWGILDGAGYRMEVPRNWNGKLVLYAHGYRGTGLELKVGHPVRLRKHLLEKGYAWAASSYSTNGFNVAQGVKDTHALGELFKKVAGEPSRTYIAGHSMGGLITVALAEKYQTAYDGAFPMCGVTGDTQLFDYFTSYNVVAQALVGVVKENQQFRADEVYDEKSIPVIKKEMEFGKNADDNPLARKLKAVTENLTGGDRPLFDLAFENYKSFLLKQNTIDIRYGADAGRRVDTTDVVYQLDHDPDLTDEEKHLNDSVRRVSSEPHPAELGLNSIPVASGDINIPVLSLHNIGDLFVPFSMQQIYAERVGAHGKSDLYVPRAIRGISHCDFTVEEETAGFDALVKWVEKGRKPEGDDILNPKAVADPRFGTRFTSHLREFDPLNGTKK